jgi:hypothetical protein
LDAAGGGPLMINLVKERSTVMAYTKKRTKKITRFKRRPDVAKAQRPEGTSPLNVALASFALLGLATAILTT